MLHWFAKRLREVHEKDEKGQRGFTLIELLVVIIIIGILAAIAIPTFLSQRNKAEQKAAQANLRNAGTAQQAFYTEKGKYGPVTPGTGADDDITDFGFRQGELAVTGGVLAANDQAYCMAASGGGKNYKITQADGRPVEGTC